MRRKKYWKKRELLNQNSKNNMKLSFLPSFAFAPQGSITHVESQTSRTYTLPVTASWEIDLFGKLRNAKRQAQAALIQSEDYKQAVYSELVSNIANTYYTLLMLDEQLRISKETAQSWEETVSSTQALMDAGLADESAVSQMKGNSWLQLLVHLQSHCSTEEH